MSRNILAIGAHHDDIELGCGGAIARHVAMGDNVYVYVATNSGYANEHKKMVRGNDVALEEARNAMKILGVKEMFCGPFNTLEVEFVDSLNVEILKLVQKLNVDLAYVHWTGDIHHDHQAVARASLHSCRHVPRILMYRSNWYQSVQDFRGNFYVDITDYLDKKEQAVRAHVSEIERTGAKWISFFRNEAENAGQRIGVKYAEVFEVLKWLEEVANVIAASRQTLIANLVQQFCAAALILVLPNILSKADYAQVVYVGVLLSFAAFADVGISLAYGRVVPGLHTTAKHDDLSNWNSTTLRFGLLASAFFSVIIAALYYARYEDAPHALLVLPVPFIVFWFSFHVSRISAAGDFAEYRNSITWRALGSLLAIPLSLALGLTGWFIGTLAAAMIALSRLGKRLFTPIGNLDWALIRAHLKEGLLLSATTVLWLQLINFARLYASMRYTPDAIATYGIIAAAYQSVSALVISIFLPVSVGILGRHGKNKGDALIFARDMLKRSLPAAILITGAGIIAAPYVLHFCFPTYHFERGILTPLLLGIMFHPLFIVWGNLMVANKRFVQNLTLILFGLIVGSITALIMDGRGAIQGAAWGQCTGIVTYTLALFFTVWAKSSSRTSAIWRPQIACLLAVIMVSALIIGITASGLWA